MAAMNRGSSSASISIKWEMLEVDGVTAATKFDVRDVWDQKSAGKAVVGGFSATVGKHDIAIFRLSKPK